MISVRFPGKPFNITIIQVFPLTSNAEEAEVKWFCEDLKDFLELTSKRRKSRDTWSNRQDAIGVQNEAGQRLTEFC